MKKENPRLSEFGYELSDGGVKRREISTNWDNLALQLLPKGRSFY
jgi:hypothetical protein